MRACHFVGLRVEQARQHDAAARTRERGEARRELAQRAAQDVSQQDIRAGGQRAVRVDDVYARRRRRSPLALSCVAVSACGSMSNA